MKVNARPVVPFVEAARPVPRPAIRPPVQPGLVALAPGLSALFVDRGAEAARGGGRLGVEAADGALPRPIVSTSLSLLAGGLRAVVLLGEDAAALGRRRIEVTLAGSPVASLDPDWLQSPLREIEALAAGLAPAGRQRLARLALTAGARLFARPGGREALAGLLGRLGAPTLRAAGWRPAGARAGVLSVPVPRGRLGAVEALALLGPGGPRPLGQVEAAVEGGERRDVLHLFLAERPAPGTALAGLGPEPFLVGAGAERTGPLAPWLASRPAAFARPTVARLAAAAASDPVAAAILDEITLGAAAAPSLRITLAARTRSGLLVAAELDDPRGRAAALRVRAGTAQADIPLEPGCRALVRFVPLCGATGATGADAPDGAAAVADGGAVVAGGAAAVAGGAAAVAGGAAAVAGGAAAVADGGAAVADGGAVVADGCAAVADGSAAGAGGPVRFGLVLRSGRLVALDHPPAASLTPGVPEALAAFAPALAAPALVRALADVDPGAGPHRAERFGAGRAAPGIAIVARPGAAAESLRALVASLAAEPQARGAALVVAAAEGPEAGRAGAALAECHAIWGLPLLLVASPSGSEALRIAAALAEAGAPRALLVGPDVLPQGAGWLFRWLRALRRPDALAGGTLLGHDGAVLHAGGRCGPDGRLRLRAAGLPRRDLPPGPRAATTLLTADCAGLGPRAVAAFRAAAGRWPDPDVLLSLLAATRGGRGATTRLDARFTRYAAAPADGALRDAVRAGALAALLAGEA